MGTVLYFFWFGAEHPLVYFDVKAIMSVTKVGILQVSEINHHRVSDENVLSVQMLDVRDVTQNGIQDAR